MSKFDYVKARKYAESIIGDFGASGSVYTLGEDGGEDMLGNPLPSIPGVVIDGLVTPLLKYKQAEVNGQNILATDNYIFLHSELEPEIDMLHDSGGNTYRVMDIVKLDSVDGVRIYRKLQLRK